MSEEKSTTTTTTSTNSNPNNNNNISQLTLYECFRIGQKNYVELDNTKLSANDKEYQQLVKESISSLLKANLYINNDNIFSSNEELDDIRTDLLKYLLVPYYLSELFLKLVDQSSRVKNLKFSKTKVTEFLGRCEKLELVDKEDLAIIQREGKSDPVNRRNELISRGKRDRELREKLAHVVKRREELLKGKFGEELDDEMLDCGDEELEREFTMTLVKDAISKAVALLETIEIELPMLIQIDAIKDKHGGVLPPQAPPKSSGIGNFQILPDGRRVQLDRVFRPSHILPTITPEEAADIEMRNGRMAKGPGGAASSKENQEGGSDDEDDKEEDHEKLIQARNWADYKDDNPKGWGNTRR